MDELLHAAERVIAEATGGDARIAGERALGGGCVNEARVITLADGRELLLKSNSAAPPRMFDCEAAGLNALAAAGCIRVPHVLGCGGGEPGVARFIIMEYFPAGRPGKNFWETFGRQFAELHRQTSAAKFGFDADNYLGASAQPNAWCASWTEFWREHRLGYQLQLARRNGYADAALQRRGERLLERLDDWLGVPDEPPCLLHGDLWGGNFLCCADGAPALIDPAVYFGRREADLAMTALFGGFDHRFYAAYAECWPLAEGDLERRELYQLYHLLNHLNLFGGGYYGSCLALLKKFD